MSMDPSSMSPEEFVLYLEQNGVFQGQEEVLEQLRKLAAAGIHPLQVLSRKKPPAEEEPRERMLDSFDISGIARYIAEHSCRNIVVMCGAGISTSAGIPDFRTPGTGLYDNLQRFNLPRAESIFDLEFFRQHPGAFYELCREMWPGNFSPTPAHYFIRLLHDKGILLRCYSQNIDSLEKQAGLPAEKLVAAHGNFDAAHVIDTDPEVEVDITELKVAVEKGVEGWQALRTKFGNLVKPKIVFFGEALPDRFLELHDKDLQQCDLLIVIGTSLVVHPFAGLVSLAAPTAPRLLINREPAGTVDQLEKGFRFQLKEQGKNWRDAWSEGDCDGGCRSLIKELGWEADLDALIESKGASPVALAPWAVAAEQSSSSSSTAADQVAGRIPPNTLVTVRGLKSQPQHNGVVGKVVGASASMERVDVLLPGLEAPIALKPANITQHVPGTQLLENDSGSTKSSTCCLIDFDDESQSYSLRMGDGSEEGDVRHASADSIRLPPGTAVRVVGLTSDEGQKLNERFGRIVSFEEEAQRYAIELGDVQRKLKPVNVQP